MPNTKSAVKAMRQSLKRRKQNLKKKEAYKQAVKTVRKLITSGQKNEAIIALSQAFKTLDKAAKTHVLPKNTASRLKSRMAKAIAKLKTA